MVVASKFSQKEQLIGLRKAPKKVIRKNNEVFYKKKIELLI